MHIKRWFIAVFFVIANLLQPQFSFALSERSVDGIENWIRVKNHLTSTIYWSTNTYFRLKFSLDSNDGITIDAIATGNSHDVVGLAYTFDDGSPILIRVGDTPSQTLSYHYSETDFWSQSGPLSHDDLVLIVQSKGSTEPDIAFKFPTRKIREELEKAFQVNGKRNEASSNEYLDLTVADDARIVSEHLKRVALVIGNSEYINVSQLQNAKNDASDMAGKLSQLGFEVIQGTDLDFIGMRRSIQQFLDQVRGADVGLFFYAGHGLQVNGINYLAPVDAQLRSIDSLDMETVRLQTLISGMERNAKINLVFLDACRNNKFADQLAQLSGTRSVEATRGLAPVQSGIGTFISFSTQPDNVALDGSGRNSPFTAALLNHIGEPGAGIARTMTKVRADVLAATNGKQVPWDSSSLTSEVVLKAASGNVPNVDVASLKVENLKSEAITSNNIFKAEIALIGDVERPAEATIDLAGTAFVKSGIKQALVDLEERGTLVKGQVQIKEFDTRGDRNLEIPQADKVISSGIKYAIYAAHKDDYLTRYLERNGVVLLNPCRVKVQSDRLWVCETPEKTRDLSHALIEYLVGIFAIVPNTDIEAVARQIKTGQQISTSLGLTAYQAPDLSKANAN